jgi:hypothetical protein
MSGDNLVFEESLNTEVDTSQFIKKSWVYVNDNNSQNYTSQVVIDATPLSNAGGWINYQEGFIVMPLAVTLTSATNFLALSDNAANFSWALKNGAVSMLNSMTVEFNNQNIIQQTSFSNVFRNFKMLTSFSEEDVLNEGADILFAPDTAGSWAYDATIAGGALSTSSELAGSGQQSAAVGIGISNNRNAPNYRFVGAKGTTTSLTATAVLLAGTEAAGAPPTDYTSLQYQGANASQFGLSNFNQGMLKRQKYCNSNVESATNTGAGQQNLVNSVAGYQAVYRNGLVAAGGAGPYYANWNVFAKLRLKDLHDYFDKCPLMRGATIRMYLNTNQSIVNFTTTLGVQANVNPNNGSITAYPTLQINSVNVIGGLTCPLIVSSAELGSGCSSLPAGTYDLSVSIVRNTNSSQTFANNSTPLQACRLYAPVYYMNAMSESRYLSLAPTRQIKYRDIFQYQFSGVRAGSSFNFLVTNGINAVKSVLVVPQIAPEQTTAFTFSGALNPCSTFPSTPDPIMLTNFNILVSGVNLFLNNNLYDYENFREQLLMSNQLNANLTTGLASGLIGPNDFANLYRYYYGDCSRVLPAEENVSRSIQIVGLNQSLVNINLLVFVEFERSMTVDIATGARIE